MDAVTKEQTCTMSEGVREALKEEWKKRHERSMILIGVLTAGYFSDRILDRVIQVAREEDLEDFTSRFGTESEALVHWTREQIIPTF